MYMYITMDRALHIEKRNLQTCISIQIGHYAYYERELFVDVYHHRQGIIHKKRELYVYEYYQRQGIMYRKENCM